HARTHTHTHTHTHTRTHDGWWYGDISVHATSPPHTHTHTLLHRITFSTMASSSSPLFCLPILFTQVLLLSSPLPLLSSPLLSSSLLFSPLLSSLLLSFILLSSP